MKSSPGDFRKAIEARGASAAYAAKMERVAARFQHEPEAQLRELSQGLTQASLDDLRRRLKIYGKWVKEATGGDGSKWTDIPRIVAGRAAAPRAMFTLEEVTKLLECERIPAYRRQFYRVQATLGLRPVEAGRIEAGFVVRAGRGFNLCLPASLQKSKRADVIPINVKEASDILTNLPLLRQSLNNFERTFLVDAFRSGIGDQVDGVNRRMYDLRSFFISELLRKGADLKTVQILARHANIETTLKHYARHQSSFCQATREAAFTGA